ncbi:MAG: ABC transporter ATP-binding protein/permease [Pseudomonadota bacterium]|nr:ABC transporter ATP-binding protein/permease [Pseudomonadota bacterium]
MISARDHARPAAVLAALMIAAALSEGFGIVLLVPMLSAVSGGGLVGGRVAKILAQIGLPVHITPLLALFVGLVLLRALINYLKSLATLRFEAGLVDGLRDRALLALVHCDWRVLVTLRQSDNASLLITIFDRIAFAIDEAIAGLAGAVTLIGLAAAAWVLSPVVALTTAAAGAAVLLLYRGLRRRATDLGIALDLATLRIHADLTEKLSALRVIKSLGREDDTVARNSAEFAALRAGQWRWQNASGLGQAALEGGGAAVLAGLIWLALVRWHTPAVTILPMVALFVRALPLLGGLQQHWQNWAYARPALAAAQDLIDRAEAGHEAEAEPIANGPSRREAKGDAPELHQAIVLDHVSVRFAPEIPPALDDISLTIGARETIMVRGPSGAGKSTLADLLGGLLSPDAGDIRIDGLALTGATRRGWRRRVAYVQQEPVLLNASVRENLLWAEPTASPEQLEAALQAASAGFVHGLPQGLDTPIGEGARRLSGGERARIVLARALLRDPALLILDEATSALDAVNTAAITDALAGLKGRLALVIIGHSDAMAGLADRTLMLEAGRIAQIVTLQH